MTDMMGFSPRMIPTYGSASAFTFYKPLDLSRYRLTAQEISIISELMDDGMNRHALGLPKPAAAGLGRAVRSTITRIMLTAATLSGAVLVGSIMINLSVAMFWAIVGAVLALAVVGSVIYTTLRIARDRALRRLAFDVERSVACFVPTDIAYAARGCHYAANRDRVRALAMRCSALGEATIGAQVPLTKAEADRVDQEVERLIQEAVAIEKSDAKEYRKRRVTERKLAPILAEVLAEPGTPAVEVDHAVEGYEQYPAVERVR